MSAFACRLAGPADFAALADLRWRLKTETPDGAAEPVPSDYVQTFRRWAEGPRGQAYRHWVVERAGRVVGAASAATVDRVPAPGEEAARWAYLTNVYVRPEARGAGGGAALLAAVEAWARGAGMELVVVWPSERSYPLYERAGFVSARDPLVLSLSPDA